MSAEQAMAADDWQPPEGWRRYTEANVFMQHVGPLWERDGDGLLEYGFRIGEPHVNLLGVVHGGMLCTFLDHSLGHAAWQSIDRQPIVTINLDVNFLAGARLGDFVECRTEIVRQSRSLFFMRGTLLVGERAIAMASGVWKVIGA